MEKVRYYIVKPNLKLFGGTEVHKETEFETYNDDKTVHQTLKDLVLTTEINKETDYKDEDGKEYHSKEESKVVSNLAEGTILIWTERAGYTILDYNMVTIDEGLKMLQDINNITAPIEEGTNGKE